MPMRAPTLSYRLQVRPCGNPLGIHQRPLPHGHRFLRLCGVGDAAGGPAQHQHGHADREWHATSFAIFSAGSYKWRNLSRFFSLSTAAGVSWRPAGQPGGHLRFQSRPLARRKELLVARPRPLAPRTLSPQRAQPRWPRRPRSLPRGSRSFSRQPHRTRSLPRRRRRHERQHERCVLRGRAGDQFIFLSSLLANDVHTCKFMLPFWKSYKQCCRINTND